MGIKTNMDILACGDYNEGKFKSVTRKVKTGDISSVATAAIAMARRLKEDYNEEERRDMVLVPVPGRGGKAIYTDLIARAIGKELGIPVFDIVSGNARPSFCGLKKARKYSPYKDYKSFFGFHADQYLPYTKKIIFVDNIVHTGTTLQNMEELFPENDHIGLVYSIVGGL
jgi:predicted amidophosphoribosyltransferase